MGFTKIISYADTVEVYEYERSVTVLRRGRNTPEWKENPDMQDMGTDGKNDLSEQEQLGKRQDNARRASMAFRRIVASNLGGSTRPILVTLTYRDNYSDLTGAYKHLTAFMQSLRNKFGKDFRYVCVPEFQKRGAVHFHALCWEIPEEILLSEWENRTLARQWGKGFVFLKETDGNEKLSFYLSKYMAKAFIDPRLKNQKCYVTSRNIKRPLVQSGNFSSALFLADHAITGDPTIDRTFHTKWLGDARYRLFKVQHDNT